MSSPASSPASSTAEPAPIPFPAAPPAAAVDAYADFLAGATGGKPEAARYLGQSVRTIDEWMRPAGLPRGRSLPHFKIGKTVLFKRASIDAWLSNLEVQKPLSAVA